MSAEDQSHVYIVGGGVAGLATAYKLTEQARASGEPVPEITIIDRNADVAQGSSQAYGGLLTANSYLTVDFPRADEARTRLSTPYIPDAQRNEGVASGWALHDATKDETRWVEQVVKSADRPPEVRRADETVYHRFGLSSIHDWERFCQENPEFASACSFRYSSGEGQSGILKIYADGTGTKFEKDRDFLQGVGGDAQFCRQLNQDEAHAYCPAAVDAYGQDALYCSQQGGNINGQAFCTKMLEHLKAQGVKINFVGGQEVENIEYGGNSGDITGLQLKSQDGRTSHVGSLDDRYVFATGPDQAIWQKLGYRSSPIMGVGGTTLTVPVAEEKLHIPLKFVDKHGGPVMIPINDNEGKPCVRVGGYTVFSGAKDVSTSEPFAIDFLTRQYEMFEKLYPDQAHAFLRDQLGGDIANLSHYSGSWAGIRPVTPDNHAIVDRIPGCSNGVVVAGLGAMGALAMGAADMAAQLLGGAERDDLTVKGMSPSDTADLLRMTSIDRLEVFRTPSHTFEVGRRGDVQPRGR
ncbi:MAG TPA: FAD-dependent oxidoreductase [Rickettsiales bacterium]|nr:FAD-dependent oxidoreductase [Rickettsiales bacterium]